MAAQDSSLAVSQILADVTEGRAFAFVIMSYRKGFAVYRAMQQFIEQEIGLKCLRADDVKASGHDLLAKIHYLVDKAELVVADVTYRSPNVFYEVGYAVASHKPLVVIAKQGVKIPTDLQGVELIRYGGSRAHMEQFEHEFAEYVRVRAGLQTAHLRDMLEAEAKLPVYIVASPRYPKARQGFTATIPGQMPDRRTFGDNLGVAGLLSAFGLIAGGGPGVELVSAHYHSRTLERQSVNLFLIGSRKSNPLSGKMLDRIQRGKEPTWEFAPMEGHKEEGDWPAALYRLEKGKRTLVAGKMRDSKMHGGLVHTLDYGLIVRAPHPGHPENRLVMILAGAHSLGTGAACVAATTPSLIERIRRVLPKSIKLDSKATPFWVLVTGRAGSGGMLDAGGVEIIEAGGYSS